MKAVFFDMDRTLTKVPSPLFLATQLGQGFQGKKLEMLLEEGQISDEDFTKEIGEIAKGCTLYQLRSIYGMMPVIDGIQQSGSQAGCS